MPSRFHDLAPYRLVSTLADELHPVVHRWRSLDQRTCGAQLLRSIDSVGANIAESTGRWSAREKRQFLLIARGSLLETEHWLTRAEARGLVEPGTARRIDEIARLLNGLIQRPLG